LANSAQQLGVEPKRLSEAALKFLQSAAWPGNVRQIENLCHWLTVMAPGQTIEIDDLPAEMRESPPTSAIADWQTQLAGVADALLTREQGAVWDKLSKAFEATLIRRALAATGGKRIEAAQLLGIGRNTITRKIQDLGLDESSS
jgi:two-component system nitrogen regulation response regulator GlnG